MGIEGTFHTVCDNKESVHDNIELKIGKVLKDRKDHHKRIIIDL